MRASFLLITYGPELLGEVIRPHCNILWTPWRASVSVRLVGSLSALALLGPPLPSLSPVHSHSIWFSPSSYFPAAVCFKSIKSSLQEVENNMKTCVRLLSVKAQRGGLEWTQPLCKSRSNDSAHRFCNLEPSKSGLVVTVPTLTFPRRQTLIFSSIFSFFFNSKPGVSLFLTSKKKLNKMFYRF